MLGEEAEQKNEETVEASKSIEEAKPAGSKIYVIKTTSGQEANVANLIYARAKAEQLPIYAILVAEELRGYIFIEAAGPLFVDDAVVGVKHVKQRLPGVVSPEDLNRYLIVKPMVEELNLDDVVEVIGGPLKGMKAKVVKIDKAKNEVTIELLEATVTMPITVNADYVRVVSRSRKEEK
jgi:transcriptional antiterminator NusG